MLDISNLSQSEVLSVFKMYEDKGWAVKQQVNNIFVWLTPIVFTLLAFFTKENCFRTTSSSGTASLAVATAIFLSAVLFILVIGSLRHADRDYQKADKVMRQNVNRFPTTAFTIVMYSQRRWLPLFFRLGMPTIGGVHIGFVYSSFLLFTLSVLLWPITSSVCGHAGRQLDLVEWWDVS